MDGFCLRTKCRWTTTIVVCSLVLFTHCDDKASASRQAPDLGTTESYCQRFERVCGPWMGDPLCIDWWAELPIGNPGDQTLRTQACALFHLDRAENSSQPLDADCLGARGDSPCADAVSMPDVGAPIDLGADLVDGGGPVDAAVEDAHPEMSSPDAAPDLVPDQSPTTIGDRCFPNRFDPNNPGPDYDRFNPRIGAHCFGTNHQFIYGIEEVVFLGDSVTVGTPNLTSIFTVNDYYRSQLADALAAKFSLDPPSDLWKAYCVDPTGFVCEDGSSVELQSGDFKNCSKWGANTDDFLRSGGQIPKCFPDGGSQKRTLVVMTMGGNDIKKITEEGGEGTPIPEVWDITRQAVADMEAGIEWLKEPGRFPNGVFVIFANPFEFTDGTGDVTACPVAGLVGLEEWDDPDQLAEMVIWYNEEYMRIATENQVDMIWMLEHFCGHGFVATGNNPDTTARCYLGPNTERWFDDTCTHPNPTGHRTIADMFMAVVNEAGMAP